MQDIREVDRLTVGCVVGEQGADRFDTHIDVGLDSRIFLFSSDYALDASSNLRIARFARFARIVSWTAGLGWHRVGACISRLRK
jgi:hypothetical protein